MKKIITFIFAVAMLAACNSENPDLTPTNVEHEWSKDLDRSIPLVKSMYDKYGVGIFLQFDPKADIFYEGDSRYTLFDYVMLEKGSENADYAVKFFEESFMKYFTNAEFVKKYFPRRIFLLYDLISNDHLWYPDYIHESEFAVSDTYLMNSIHSFAFAQGYAFAAKSEVLKSTVSDYYKKYSRDNMYMFLSELFLKNHLYENIGSDYYRPEVMQYYGRYAGGEESSCYYQEFGTYKKWVPISWFVKFGFPGANGVYNIWWDYYDDQEVRIAYNSDGTGSSSYTFPEDKAQDFRAGLDALISLDAMRWGFYTELIRSRLIALVKYFDTIGFDIRSFNPYVGEVIPREN